MASDVPQRPRSAGVEAPGSTRLEDGARVAVIGGGPAGSFFSFFLLEMAARVGLDVRVDIYEQKDFSQQGPPGCNMCGGIVSESLVQHLATEGIRLPSSVIQRGIDSYLLHMDAGSVRIATPHEEKRIGAVHRGAGPRRVDGSPWESFDGFLLTLAELRGAHLLRRRVEQVRRVAGRPAIDGPDGTPQPYDLLVVAAGVNGAAPHLLEEVAPELRPPRTTKTAIREYALGHDVIGRTLGSAMQVYLLNLPRLEFAAIVPKGDHASLCMLGEEIDKQLMDSFLAAPEVRASMPADWDPAAQACRCSPRMNVGGLERPWGERLVLIGDAGITRLYKDGIGAAYRTAKAAARTAVFEGVSAAAFARHYGPVCRAIAADNALGRLVFLVTRLIQRWAFARRAIHRMVAREQADRRRAPRLSTVLWDMFTGSAPYREILLRTLHPAFVARLAWELARALGTGGRPKPGASVAAPRDA